MINVGINGLGRIGKCVLLQLLENKNIKIKALNILNHDIHQLEKYIKYDSIHHYPNNFSFQIIDNETISINNNEIRLFNEKDASNINWKKYNINYVIDATGIYLTKEKASKHNVEYVIMSAPPKDNTPMFVYGVNHKNYKGENIVSNASCTTNCITPLLKILNDEYGIVKGNFTTIHSTTSSQSLMDRQPNKNRTYRSIFNNIIPHTTGASKAIDIVIPEINGLIKGTSLRIPTSNVSIVDTNICLKKKVFLSEIMDKLRSYNNINVNDLKLVSSDFMTTTCPTIIDSDGCMELNDNEFKFMVWYDNEWSYSAQLVKILMHMIEYNQIQHRINDKYFIENGKYCNKRVLLRVDYNIPVHENKIIDTYRIDISLKTIQEILKDNPKYLLLVTHFGRPKNNEEKYSLKFLVNYLEEKLNKKIVFLKDSLNSDSLNIVNNNEKNSTIYLAENIRFMICETNNNILFNDFINKFCDIYVNDAFGVCHRNHSSITAFSHRERYYGYVIQKEIKLLDTILYSTKKKLAIIGGGKMDTKLELLKHLCKTMDTIYICGGNINSILKKGFDDYLEEISSHKAEIVLMEDGLKATSLDDNEAIYGKKDELKDNEYFYDCGGKSIDTLSKLINNHDLIFWNGVLGVVEMELYKGGSFELFDLLCFYKKTTIVAGGDTVGFVNNYNVHENIHLCSGGGASIDYLTSGSLVGLEQFMKQ